MTGFSGSSSGPCRLYGEACRLLEPAREAYRRIAEGLLGLDPSREALAAWEASLRGDQRWACRFLDWLFEAVPGSRVCVVGPLSRGLPTGCDVVFTVESPWLYGGDAVFTDLDSRGAPLEPVAAWRFWLVHVHGDNWLHALARAPPRAVYTSQAYCVPPVLGTGGFTDGDRPVAVAMALGAGEIRVYGFDFERATCAHKSSCSASKPLKLRAARLIIEWLSERYGYRAADAGEALVLKPG